MDTAPRFHWTCHDCPAGEPAFIPEAALLPASAHQRQTGHRATVRYLDHEPLPLHTPRRAGIGESESGRAKPAAPCRSI